MYYIYILNEQQGITNMNMNTLTRQALEAAMKITGTNGKDEHTHEIAFKLACAAMAEELAKQEAA